MIFKFNNTTFSFDSVFTDCMGLRLFRGGDTSLVSFYYTFTYSNNELHFHVKCIKTSFYRVSNSMSANVIIYIPRFL